MRGSRTIESLRGFSSGVIYTGSASRFLIIALQLKKETEKGNRKRKPKKETEKVTASGEETLLY
jgi:hypothetical protein